MFKNLADKNTVTHSNRITEARYVLSAQEQKIILSMVSMIEPDDKNFCSYKVYQRDLAEIMGMDLKSCIREFDKITDRLMSRILRIPQEDGTILKTHWVSDIVFHNGFLELFFSPNLKPYLLNLKSHFTTYKLGVIVQFSGKHTIRIYQLLKKNSFKNNFEINLSDLREILGLGENKYRNFYDFKRWILYKAMKEMSEKEKSTNLYKSDLNFSFETIKTGRSISRLKIRIIKQKTVQEKTSIISKKTPPKTQPPIEIIPKESIDPATQNSEFQRMHTLGIPKNQALYFVKKYDAVYIQGKFNVLEYKQKKEIVDNPAGFLIRAMKENWKSEDLIRQQMEQQKVQIQRKKEAEQKRLKELEERREQLKKEFSLKTRTQFLKTLSTMEKEFLKTEFLKTVSGFTRKSLPKDDIDKLLLSPFFVLELTPYIPNYEEDKQRYIDENL